MASNSSGRLHYEHPLSSDSSLESLYIDGHPPYRSLPNSLWLLFLILSLWLVLKAHAAYYARRFTARKLIEVEGIKAQIPAEACQRTSYVQLPVATAYHCDVGKVTIDTLPDDALLEIFDCYLHDEATSMEAWHTMVHVCKKWRNVVFGSPRRLDLRLYCEAKTPVREILNIWPPELPILVWSDGHEKWGMDNIIAALEHIDRICVLGLVDIPSSQLEKVLAEMQRPSPALTDLYLQFHGETPLVVPSSFLGGSAPLLQTLDLNNIPFPGLPKLLLSATHLVELRLLNIPYSGHFSPEMMATCLSVPTRLESLEIGFESPRSRPGRQSRHSPPRTHLPFLTKFWFKGVCEYLEDLVARIDAPLLDSLEIIFFHQLIFDTPRLAQFIGRAPKIKAQDGAHVEFTNLDVRVTLPNTNQQTLYRALKFTISCSQSDWQLSSLVQVCSSSFPQALICTVEDLYISENRFFPVPWQDDLESNQWLELLHPFTAVKDLKLSRDFTRHIAPALQELVGYRTMEVLPALQTISIDVPLTRDDSDEPVSSGFPFPSRLVQESFDQFVASRELASHPITIRH